MDQIRLLLQPTRRVVYAVGLFLLVVVLLIRAHTWGLPGVPGRQESRLLRDIHNSTLGFEKIFVIGLPSRTDRRDGMVLQAALSNMELDFVDGVNGKEVPDKAIPKTYKYERPPDAVVGSWRAHMNAIREVVQRNLTSVLIFEDDVDWDVRIKNQLRDFALSANALTQPLRGSRGSYADPSFPVPAKGSSAPGIDLDFNRLPATVPPTVSPYGDDWDVLWLGHCGMQFPSPDNSIPKGRVIQYNDATVAPKRNLWSLDSPFTLVDKYPEHTRAVTHVQEGVCTLGYAVSQRGARRLLHEVGLKDVDAAFDILLRWFCEGEKGRARGRQCLTTQPGIFQHYVKTGPASESSDIGDHPADRFTEVARTDMIRWSVRLNAEALLEGRVQDVVDQFPDEKQ